MGCYSNQLEGISGPGAPHTFAFDRIGDLGAWALLSAPAYVLKLSLSMNQKKILGMRSTAAPGLRHEDVKCDFWKRAFPGFQPHPSDVVLRSASSHGFVHTVSTREDQEKQIIMLRVAHLRIRNSNSALGARVFQILFHLRLSSPNLSLLGGPSSTCQRMPSLSRCSTCRTLSASSWQGLCQKAKEWEAF